MSINAIRKPPYQKILHHAFELGYILSVAFFVLPAFIAGIFYGLRLGYDIAGSGGAMLGAIAACFTWCICFPAYVDAYKKSKKELAAWATNRPNIN